MVAPGWWFPIVDPKLGTRRGCIMPIDAVKFLETQLIIANGAAISSALSMQTWTRAIGVYVPDITDGDVGLEYSLDKGSTYVPVQDLWGQDDCVVVASGKDPCYVDFSPFVQSLPRGNSERQIRFTCAAQGAARTIIVIEVG